MLGVFRGLSQCCCNWGSRVCYNRKEPIPKMGLASSKAANSIAAGSNGGGGGSKHDSVIVETRHHHHPDIQQPCSLLPSPSSVIDSWKPSSCHVRQASIRSRNLQPMPDIGELDRRFAKVLVSGSLTLCPLIDLTRKPELPSGTRTIRQSIYLCNCKTSNCSYFLRNLCNISIPASASLSSSREASAMQHLLTAIATS